MMKNPKMKQLLKDLIKRIMNCQSTLSLITKSSSQRIPGKPKNHPFLPRLMERQTNLQLIRMNQEEAQLQTEKKQ